MENLRRVLIGLVLIAAGLGTAWAQEEPADAPAETNAVLDHDSPTKSRSERLTFNFRYQPWQDVLDWFAEQAGLSLLIESPPPGTFNYRDARSYSPAEALDVLNSVLLTKGYTLVRRDRMLVLVNLEDGIPPNLVPDVPLEELDERGEYELIRVLFPVWNMTPEQAAEEVQPLLGPQGKAITLPQARQIQVTETAGRLRTIRSIVQAVEQPELGKAGVREFELNYLTYESAMPTIRQMMGIPADASGTPDGSMQISKSATEGRLLFRGTAQHSARLQEILRLIDVPAAARGIAGSPQLEVYSLTFGDPDSIKDALEVLLGDDPSVNLSADEDNGFLVAIAPPAQQATIRATIDQMQRDTREVDVITLANLDPQVAVLAINKLFGGTGDEPDPKAPRVDADIASRSLLVRGTSSQVEQIRALLRKLGENEEEGAGVAAKRQRVRLLPLTGSAARSAISQIEEIWPNVRTNRIRVLAPSATIPVYRPSDSSGETPAADTPPRAAAAPAEADTGSATPELLQMLFNGNRTTSPATPAEKVEDPKSGTVGQDRMTTGPNSGHVFRLAADQLEVPAPLRGEGDEEGEDPSSPEPHAAEPAPGHGSPILIAPGPGGTLIASDDVEALDQLEELLSVVAGRNSTSGREYAVFYLKYSKASTIAEVLAAIFGGRPGGNDRGIIGEMANNALGGVGGALMGDLLLGGGGSSGAFTSANVDIVPDARLNALIVHAKPADLDTIEQLLKVLDQRTGPELVEAEAQPRLIPVYNTTATEISEIVQQVYQDRMTGPGAVMSPQEMMRMLRGGPNTEQSVQKMSIAVDIPNNMLVVRAPDALFEEVKQLVAELDQSLADSPEVTRIVSLKPHTNSAAVQKAVTSLLENVSSSSSETNRREGRRGDDDDDSPEERARRAMRRNWEMMQEFRRAQERMSGGDRGSDGDRGRGGGGDFRGRGDFRGGGDFRGFRGRGGDGGERRGRD